MLAVDHSPPQEMIAGWAIVAIVVACAVVVVLIVVPLLLLLASQGGDNGMAVSVERTGGAAVFDAVVGGEERTFRVRVTQKGKPAIGRPVRLMRSLTGTTGAMGVVRVARRSRAPLDHHGVSDAVYALTDQQGMAEFRWRGAGHTVRDNRGDRAWTERLSFTAYEGGTDEAPAGATISRTLIMTPMPSEDDANLYVASALIDASRDRILLRVRDAAQDDGELPAILGSGGVVSFLTEDGRVVANLPGLRRVAHGLIEARFAPNRLDDLVAWRADQGCASVVYLTATTDAIESEVTGARLPDSEFTAIIA